MMSMFHSFILTSRRYLDNLLIFRLCCCLPAVKIHFSRNCLCLSFIVCCLMYACHIWVSHPIPTGSNIPTAEACLDIAVSVIFRHNIHVDKIIGSCATKRFVCVCVCVEVDFCTKYNFRTISTVLKDSLLELAVHCQISLVFPNCFVFCAISSGILEPFFNNSGYLKVTAPEKCHEFHHHFVLRIHRVIYIAIHHLVFDTAHHHYIIDRTLHYFDTLYLFKIYHYFFGAFLDRS